MNTGQERKGWRPLVKLLATILVLGPCLYGFGTKFWELINTYRQDSDGAFAIAPIVNYLLASAGFLLMFVWAALNGMFRNIERPKQLMLDNEARLDGWRQPAPLNQKEVTR
jgi:hypothetical protein